MSGLAQLQASLAGRQVPEHFTFAIKASQRITHHARLKEEAASPLDYLLKTTASLGMPKDRRFTIEFRHESWFDDDVATVLREHVAAEGQRAAV